MTIILESQKKEYTVFIDIYSSPGHLLSERELSEMGLSGVVEYRRNPSNEPFWRIESGLPDKATLIDHIDALTSLITEGEPIEGDLRIRKAYLNIGVYYFETVTCTVSIPAKTLRPILAKFPEIEIEISCYPSTR